MLAVTNRIFLPVGTVVMGWAAWTIVTGSIWMDQESVLFLGMVSFYVGTLANLQDFRDVEGDMKVPFEDYVCSVWNVYIKILAVVYKHFIFFISVAVGPDFHHTYHSFTKHFIFFISAGLVFL